MIPQIDGAITQDLIVVPYPSLTYKFTEEKIAGFVNNIEAIKQSITHILSIERYAYDIYDNSYGSSLEQYIGAEFSYIEATIENTLKDAFKSDDRIRDIEVTNIEQTDIDSVSVEFIVYSNIGTFEMETNINA